MKTAMVLMAAIGLAGVSTAAVAQDWKAAVAAGTVGEQSDGYLGVVGGGSSAMVSAVSGTRQRAPGGSFIWP